MPTQTKYMRPLARLGVSRASVDARATVVDALDTHAGLIISSAARVLGNLADAEDVGQDIAEKLLRSPPADVQSWPALLKTMDVNAALDRVRRRKSTTDIELTQSTNDPENALYDEQRADILRHALSRLPERDGRLFALYYFGDLTHAEVGKRLDMTENAVSVALHRLRQRLTLDVRSLLDTEEGDPEK